MKKLSKILFATFIALGLTISVNADFVAPSYWQQLTSIGVTLMSPYTQICDNSSNCVSITSLVTSSALNNVAAVDPTVGDDSDDGYAPTSTWYNSVGGTYFVCTDATVGAAVWVSVSGAAATTAALVSIVDAGGYFTATNVETALQEIGLTQVKKVGTPVDNQVGVWTGDGTIEGTTGLTYDGSNLQLTGDIGSTGTRITKGWFTAIDATNLIGALTGNASTSTSLAANGADCSAGNSPLGVDASGAVESCFDVWTEAENTSAAYFNALSDFTGTLTDTKICTYDSAGGEIDCDTTPIATARTMGLSLFDSDTDTATGNGVDGMIVPASMGTLDVTAVVCTVHTAGTTGTTDIQLRRRRGTSDVDVLSTVITIDTTETSSTTAAAAAVINTSNDDINEGDLLYWDVDAVSTTAAKGLSCSFDAS